MANTVPMWPNVPVLGMVTFSAANTSRTATGTTSLNSIVTGAAAGTHVFKVVVIATGSTSAGTLRFWYYPNTGNSLLIQELTVTAITVSSTVLPYYVEWVPQSLILPQNHQLLVTTHIAEGFNVFAFGGSF